MTTNDTRDGMLLFRLFRDGARASVDSVKPGTLRGAVPVIVWLAIVVGLTVIGRSLVPGLGIVWLVVALLIMVPVAGWWPNRRRVDT